MLRSYLIQNEKNATLFAAILLAIIIFAIYLPLLFLNQTYLIDTPIPSEYVATETKSTIFGITIDYSMHGNYPDIKLASNMFLNGTLPLWNPYVGLGYPLAADTTHHVFSPFNLGFLLPEEFWDLTFLIVLWTAGFFTFVFLRNLGLNFFGSLTGGLFYMLSGGFSWYLPNPNPFVMFATPLILLSIDKILQNNNPKYIVFLSMSFSFSILGGHLQSLLLQSVLILGYLLYRLISFYFLKPQGSKNFNILGKSMQIFLGLLGGIGITSFYILPVTEYLQNGVLERSSEYGLINYNLLSLPSVFVPYVIGPLHTYWTTNVQHISLFGYSGVFALFFSVIGLLISIKDKTNIHRFIPLFFILISVFAMMRLANIPLISSFGELPIFNVMYFGNYAGVLIPIGFAIAGGFGIHYVTQNYVSKKIIICALLFSIVIILTLLIPVFFELFEDNFPPHITPTDARHYVFFQLIQTFFFIVVATLISLIILKKSFAIYLLISTVILELSLYVPFGLHPIWMAYKFLLVSIITGMLLVLLYFFKSNSINNKNFKVFVIFALTAFFIGSLLLSYYSPYGMPTKTNSFNTNPLTGFLKNNLGNQRFFSFEHTMGPNYPAAFNINSLAKLSSFNISNFYTFSSNFLDSDSDSGRLGEPSWSSAYGPEKSILKFFDNKKYFDFLGVKYVITQGYDFNTLSYGIMENSGNFIKLTSIEDNFHEKFNSPADSISSIGLYLGSSLFEKNDNVILTFDSIPFDEKYHRSSSVINIKNGKINEFKFDPPIFDTLNKSFQFSVHYPNSSEEKFSVLFYTEKSYDIPNHIQFYVDDIENDDIFIPFTITPFIKKVLVVFSYNDIYINENLDAFPRAYLVHKVVQSDNAQKYLLENPQINLRETVILESPLDTNFLSQSDMSLFSNDNLEIVELTENNIILKTFSNENSILVLTDIFYPGWKASIDDEPSNILKANGLVRALSVPSGNHTIKFEYVPDTFVWGLIISILSGFSLLIIYIYLRHRS